MSNDGGVRFQPCGGLLGCGDDGGREYMVAPDAVDAALTGPTRDRLEHMDEVNQDALASYVAAFLAGASWAPWACSVS